VVDKWEEHWEGTAPNTTWTPDSNFDKYLETGGNKGEIDPAILTPDVYVAPTTSSPGTGFRPYDANGYTADYGREITLKVGSNTDFEYATGWFRALALNDSSGGSDYNANIKGCIGVGYKIGDELAISTEPGDKVGPTKQGVETDDDSLIKQDPGAWWNPDLNDGRGGVDGSMYKSSPRIVAIPLINPDIATEAQKGGRTTVPIANIMGFFVEGMDASGKGVTGRLVTIPNLKSSGAPQIGQESAFSRLIRLIR
jgi:hypothetical protein